MTTLEKTVVALRARLDALERKGQPSKQPKTVRVTNVERNTKTGEVVADLERPRARPQKKLTRTGFWADRFDALTLQGRLLKDGGYGEDAIRTLRERYIDSEGADNPPMRKLGNGLIVDAQGERITGYMPRPKTEKLEGWGRNGRIRTTEPPLDEEEEEFISVASMFDPSPRFRVRQRRGPAPEPETDYEPLDGDDER